MASLPILTATLSVHWLGPVRNATAVSLWNQKAESSLPPPRYATAGRPFEVWGGDQLRDFTYVDDAVDAFLMAAASDAANGRVFNLGGDRVVSLRQLAAMLARLGSRADAFVIREFPADRKAIDIGDYYSDFSAIRESLGWTPRVPLTEGLARTVAYYREYLANYL